MYSLLLVIIYIAFISLGLPDSLLGAGWPIMHFDLNVDIPYLGIVTMVISGGTIISSILSNRLTTKLGTPIVTIISVLLTALALLGFSFANKFWMLLVFAVPFGLGAGAIDAALNNYVALHYTSRHMSWLHCFWGVGTIISPFVMSFALTNTSWNSGFRIIAYIQLGISLLLFITLPIWKVNKTTTQAQSKALSIIQALKIKGVPYLLLGFFAYCAAETTAMQWATTYIVQVKGMQANIAAQYSSFVFIGITAGRFLAGFFMNKLGDRRMIIIGTSIVVLGIIYLLIPFANPSISLIGMLIIGLGFAPIYPCVIHSTPVNFGAENSGAIIGIQMASAYVGSTFMPPLFGLLGKYISFSILPLYLAFFAILMIVMIELTYRKTASLSAVK